MLTAVIAQSVMINSKTWAVDERRVFNFVLKQLKYDNSTNSRSPRSTLP
jgi:hypothetical protein